MLSLRGHLRTLAACSLSLSVVLSACAPSTAPPAANPPAPSRPAAVSPTAPAAPAAPAPSAPVAPSTSGPSPTATPRVSAPAAPATQNAKYGGVIQRYERQEPANSDITQLPSYIHIRWWVPVFSLLVMRDLNAGGKLTGDLAEQWQASPDGQSYTFRLRNGVKWHDGASLTAADVKFTYDRAAAPPEGTVSPRSGLYSDLIQSVQTSDASTVQFTLKRPSANFLDLASDEGSLILPKHVIAERGHMKDNPIGTGPFKFQQWARGTRISVVKNKDYFLKDRPYLEGVNTVVIVDPATQLAALRAGRVDMSPQSSTGITARDIETLKKSTPGLVFQQSETLSYFGPTLNFTKEPFKDIRVRKAFFLAYDQPELIRLVAPGDGAPGGIMSASVDWSLPKNELAAVPGLKSVTPQDIGAAKKLLADAGYPNGLSLPYLGRRGPEWERVGVVVGEQVRRAGFNLAIRTVDDPTLFKNLSDHTFDVAHGVYPVGIADPDYYLVYFRSDSPNNSSGYGNKELDSLIDKQARTLNVDERKTVVHDIQRRLLDQFLVRPGFFPINAQAWWSHVKGYASPLVGLGNNNFRDVWMDK